MKRLEFVKRTWLHRPPHAVPLLVMMLLCMALLLLVTVQAFAVDLTQEEKADALRQAYRINGSMSGPFLDLTLVPPPEPEPPLVFPKLARAAVTTPKVRADVCRRHGMRKVVSGRSWRCRR